jgi:hypothetical protein
MLKVVIDEDAQQFSDCPYCHDSSSWADGRSKKKRGFGGSPGPSKVGCAWRKAWGLDGCNSHGKERMVHFSVGTSEGDFVNHYHYEYHKTMKRLASSSSDDYDDYSRSVGVLGLP